MRGVRTASVSAAMWMTAAAAWADVPSVVADIAPVHALAARVMDGVGVPDLLLPPGASPHVHALRPSQAAALESADLVVRVGPGLTPWLETPLARLAGDAAVLTLTEAEGTELLPYRWESEPEHAEDAHGHDADEADPHAWFDPGNAAVWLDAIAAELARLDPANASVYARNATAGAAEIAAAFEDAAARLAALGDVRLIVYHDALSYFERATGLEAAGAMTTGERPPGPRQLADLRAIAAAEPVCLVLEPGVDKGLAEAVDATAPVVTVDPQGRDLDPGPDYFPALIRGIAEALAGCG